MHAANYLCIVFLSVFATCTVTLPVLRAFATGQCVAVCEVIGGILRSYQNVPMEGEDLYSNFGDFDGGDGKPQVSHRRLLARWNG
jgi:hypothetical protein